MTVSSASWSHEFVEANGLRFHCVTAGSGPLVLLLHGFPQFWYAWRHQIPALAREFRVVAPDLRGYGDSDKPSEPSAYRVGTLADDVVALVHAFGEQRARIVGHDWGGGVAWTVALEHAEVVERLAILNCPHPKAFVRALRSNPRQLARSWYMFFFQLPWLPEKLVTSDFFLERAFRGMAFRKDTFSDADMAAFREAIRKPGAASGAIHYYRAAFRGWTSASAATIAEPMIHAPTLLVWAENDAALGKELTYGMESWFTGSFRVHYVPRCSHWVNEERPEEVNALLLRFLLGKDGA